MKKKTLLSMLLGVVVSAAALFFAIRNVPFADLFTYLTRVDYFWIFPSIFFSLASFGLRAYRWQVILDPALNVRYWQAYHPLMIGFMINCILPGRVGEVARPIILRQQTGVPFSTGIATLAA